MHKNLCTYLMSCGGFDIDDFAAALDRVEDVCVVLAAKDKFATIRVTVHDPFYEMLYVLCSLVNII